MLPRRKWWWIQLSYLSALLLTALALLPHVREVTEEDRIAARAVSLEHARREGDWGTLWDAMTESSRSEVDAQLIQRHFGAGGLEDGRPTQALLYDAEHAGTNPETFRTLTPRARFVASRAAWDNPFHRGFLGFLESLIHGDPLNDLVASVSLDGPRAVAVVMMRTQRDSGTGWGIGYDFLDVNGDWRIRKLPDQLHVRYPEGVLAFFISRFPQWQRDTDFVVEVGPGMPDETTLGLLTAVLRSRLGRDHFERFVLIDADPEHRLQEIISVIDAVMAAGSNQVNLARSGRPRLDPGIRVNGVPLLEIPLVHILPPATDHPALARAFSINPR